MSLPDGWEEVAPAQSTLPQGWEEVDQPKKHEWSAKDLLAPLDVGANLLAQSVGTAGSGALLAAQTPFLGVDEALRRHTQRMEDYFTPKALSSAGEKGNALAGDVFGFLGKHGEELGSKYGGNIGGLAGQVAGDLATAFVPAHIGALKLKGREAPITRIEPRVDTPISAKFIDPDAGTPGYGPSLGERPMQVTPEGQAFTPPPDIYRQRAEEIQRQAQEGLDRSTADITYENVPPDGVIPRSAPDGRLTVPRGNEWAVDENGMPVRQGMPEDLPPTETQTINADQSHVNDLGNAIQEANGPKLGVDETYGAGQLAIPKSQRGAIDISALEDGMGFVAKIGDRVVGYLKDNLPVGMAQKLGENANVDIVKVDPAFQRQGIGQALYQAFDEKHGGNIAPSGKTSPSAWALWKRQFPDKVDSFISQEAGRLGSGAPLEQVLGNITDPAVRRAVVEQVNPLRPLDATPVPKGQRGGIDFNAVGDALKKMRDMVSPSDIKGAGRPAMAKTSTEVMHSVPGLKEATQDWIPPNPSPADIKADVLKEGAENGKIVLKSLRSGAIMAGEQRNSALIQGVGRSVLNALKRADRNERTHVQPVEQLIKRMVSKDIKGLAQVFKDEMFQGFKYSSDQMAKLGMNAKQMATYASIRDMFTRALDTMNTARVKAGMEPVTAKEAYLSSRWGGSWRTPVYDKAGKLVWYIAENSKRGAQKALDYLAKEHGNIDITKSVIENRSKNPAYTKKNRGSLEDSYLDMLSVLDKNDPRVAHVRTIMEDAMANQAYDTLGQAKHFDPKSNIRGFIGDKPWKDATADAYDMFHAQMNYAKGAFKWAELQDAVSNVKGVLADKEINELQPHNTEFARQYVKNALGFGEHPVIAAIEREVANKIGFDRSIASSNLQLVKGTWLMQKLALNVGYYASQGLQMLNSIPEHAYLTGKGYSHNILKTIAGANIDFAAAGVSSSSKGLGKEIKAPMTRLGKDAWDYMEQNGISKRNIMDEARGLGKSPVWEGLNNLASTPIGLSEQIIRTNTFLQFAHHLEQSGKFTDRTKMFEMAEEATNRAMVDFRKEERASLFNSSGLVGSAASTLKSYLVNYYNNFGRYSQEALNGRPRALLSALAVQGTVYGVLNLPGMQEANDSWEAFKKVLPDSAFQHVKDWNIKQKLIDLQGDWAYGGVSKATGLNLASRGNIQINTSLNPLDSMFPFVSDAYKQAKAVAHGVFDHNQTSAAQAAYTLAPNGPAQGNIASSTPFQNGQGPNGTTVFQKPSKLVDHEYDYARTPEQITKKKWGFSDLEESRTKDLTFSVNNDEHELNTRRKGNITAAFDALVRHDEASFDKEVGYYTAFNGDPTTFVNGLITEAMKAKVSREALTAIQSNPNIPALKKLALIKQLVGAIK